MRPAIRELFLCDDVVEGDDIPQVKPRIDLPRKGGDAGRKRRCICRDAHSDHNRIELRHRGCAIDVRSFTPIGGERP